jgi:hypothetical protein
MQWPAMGREGTRSVWDQAPAAQRNGHPTMRYGEPTGSVQSPSPPFGRLGSSAGLDRPFEMVCREFPKLDCAAEAHFNVANDDDRSGHRRPHAGDRGRRPVGNSNGSAGLLLSAGPLEPTARWLARVLPSGWGQRQT